MPPAPDLAAARHPAGPRRGRDHRRTWRRPQIVAWFGGTHAQFQHRQASGWAKRWWRPATRRAARALIRSGWTEGSFDTADRTGHPAEGRRLSDAGKRPRPAGQSAVARRDHRGPAAAGARRCRAPPASPMPASRWRSGLPKAQAGAGQGRATRSDPGLLFDWARALRAGRPRPRSPCHAAARARRRRWSRTMRRAGGRK